MVDFDHIFNESAMIKMQSFLRNRAKKITCAESCTGGLLSYLITSVAGSSDIFNGSIVSYSDAIKTKELQVSTELLKKEGAVSQAVVEAMLKGVIDKFNSDYAMAISGIAGPTGSSDEIPVGTVFIGICEKSSKPQIKKHFFSGTRKEIQLQAAKTALRSLYAKMLND